nr:MAG TPA: hypothetical protein [Caudoviricetes sp.]
MLPTPGLKYTLGVYIDTINYYNIYTPLCQFIIHKKERYFYGKSKV